MPKIKIRKKYLFLVLVPFAIGVMVRFVLGDLNLIEKLDMLRGSLENLPTVIVENVEFEREASGSVWHVRIPVAWRRQDVIEAQSIDVHRRLADGKDWFFTGLQGFYSERAASADVTVVFGTMQTDKSVLNLESPFLTWSSRDDVFLFPKGLILYDAEFILETDLASVDNTGVVELNEGGVIRWKRIAE